jgi:hypothetical protein
MRFPKQLDERGKLSPELRSWCSDPGSEPERTVLVRFGTATDPQRAADALANAGARVASAGMGVISAIISADHLLDVSRLPWVLAVEEPRKYYPKLAGEGFPETRG